MKYDYKPEYAGKASRQFTELVPFSLNPSSYTPERNLLFHNNGNGTFTEVPKKAGVNNPEGRSLSAAWADFDGGGWPDLAFANGSLDAERLEPSLILRNEGGKGFSEWSYLPAFSTPSNAVGLAVTEPKGGRRPAVRLIPNPILRRARAAF